MTKSPSVSQCWKATNRQNRRVQFTDDCVSQLTSPLNKLSTQTEWKSIWYSEMELNNMRSEARDICSRIRATISGPTKPSYAKDSLTRGLEQRFCTERQRRKYISSKYIVKTSIKLRELHQSNDDEKLAAVARRCNEWATILAVEEAARDFVDVYSDDFQVLVSCNKRNFEESINCSRNVRQRCTN
jgi:hypothetical protein